MDWFRSYHGAPTDPKWRTIARRAGVLPGMVASIVWALFDHASQHENRGSVASFDPEEIADFYGYEPAEVESVVAALRDKGFIVDDRLSTWDKRQPKREDVTATDRKRAQRERDAAEKAGQPATSRDVTHGHGSSRDVTTEKRRVEEEKKPSPPPSAGTTASAVAEPAMVVVKAFMAAREQRWPDAMPANNAHTQAEHAKILLSQPGATVDLVCDLVRDAVAGWKDPVPPGGVGAFRTSITNRIAQHARAREAPPRQASGTPVGGAELTVVADQWARERVRLQAFRRTGRWDYSDPAPGTRFCQIPRNVLEEELGSEWLEQHATEAA